MQLRKMMTEGTRANAWYNNNGISIGVCPKGSLAKTLAAITTDSKGIVCLTINSKELKNQGIKEVRI